MRAAGALILSRRLHSDNPFLPLLFLLLPANEHSVLLGHLVSLLGVRTCQSASIDLNGHLIRSRGASLEFPWLSPEQRGYVLCVRLNKAGYTTFTTQNTAQRLASVTVLPDAALSWLPGGFGCLHQTLVWTTRAMWLAGFPGRHVGPYRVLHEPQSWPLGV